MTGGHASAGCIHCHLCLIVAEHALALCELHAADQNLYASLLCCLCCIQAMSPARPESPYSESVADEDLQPSTISEVIMECFAGMAAAASGANSNLATLLCCRSLQVPSAVRPSTGGVVILCCAWLHQPKCCSYTDPAAMVSSKQGRTVPEQCRSADVSVPVSCRFLAQKFSA